MVLNCCVFFVSSVLLLSLLFCVDVGAISFSFLMFLLCFVVVIIGVLYGFHLRFPFFGGGGAWIGCGRRVVLFSVMGLFLYSR